MLRRLPALGLLLVVGLAGCATDLEPTSAPEPATQSSSLHETSEASTEQPTPEPAPPEVTAVDHIGLAVTDLEASKAFFIDGLGFAVRGEDPSYPAAFLSNGHAMVTLWGIADPGSATPFDRKRNVGLHHLALSVTSFEALEALHARLKDMPGVRIEFAPELAYGGPAKHMMVYEPSGNRVELVHRPKTP